MPPKPVTGTSMRAQPDSIRSLAIAYLPEALGLRFGATPLQVTGCLYSCRQNVMLVALRAHETGWGEKLFRN